MVPEILYRLPASAEPGLKMVVNMKFVIATRGSKISALSGRARSKLLQRKFPEHDWQIQTFTTTGDRLTDRPLSEFGGKGAFVEEIEEALLKDEADLAVHSLKDVPGIMTPGLALDAFLPREDPRDVWVSDHKDMQHLPAGERVGTSSLRREILIRFYRPDLKVEMLRGNLDKRLRKLREGQYDAIVCAAAGLHRLNLYDESTMYTMSRCVHLPMERRDCRQTRENYKVAALVHTLN